MEAARTGRQVKPWQTILLFGVAMMAIYGFGSFTFDYYAGAATAGPGVWGDVGGVGMFFVYVMGYFIALAVILPMLLLRRFGVGVAVFLPYAIVGLFVEYYMELVLAHSLVGLWAVPAWCAVGPSAGFCADLAYRFLPCRLSAQWRASVTGVVFGTANFLLVLLALSLLYIEPQTGQGSYLGVAYYGLPFLLVSSGFAGYTAHAITHQAKPGNT